MAKTFSFTAKRALKRINKTIEDNSIIFHNNFTALQMDEIAGRTPIKDGFAKGNWDAGFTSNISPTSERDRTKTGLRARRKAQKQLKGGLQKADGRVSYIKNGVVGQEGARNGYIIQLENGKSKQAPFGMVRISIHNGQKIAKKAFKLKVGSL